MTDPIAAAGDQASTRFDLAARIAGAIGARSMAEIGVFRGEFAEHMLRACPEIESYWMIDPWRHLGGWDKPANVADDVFQDYHDETMARTDFAADRRHVLRGTTQEVIAQIPEASLDMAYIDGDHTLRGITIDLKEVLPRMRPGGVILGDDFCRNVWQHGTEFAPSQVFPYALYFAEAHGLPAYTFRQRQFAIVVDPSAGFTCTDLGNYGRLDIREVYLPRTPSASPLRPEEPRVARASVLDRVKRLLR
ncbi:class I SAM-dependent methyltransferase [Palleronia sediminis]|uniref:Class I SAM-dependent methyltransferase n=1 Tax=Palleronia sediminis TaxID=2547833 RepID=A0A4R6AK39_9RHOB|nr:class I SAM-dependent methyltransferase [Palleronia sediminis]TDL83544.1 class I SAM-dependent methyltransferase [Palleronia sediminis]